MSNSSSRQSGKSNKRRINTTLVTRYVRPRVAARRMSSSSMGMYRSLANKDYVYRVVSEFNITMNYGAAGNYGLNDYAPGAIPATFSTVANGQGANGMCVTTSLNETVVYVGASAGVAYANTNYAGLAALYDEFKIDKVNFRMVFNSNSSNVTGASVLPTLIVAPDYDDITPPANAMTMTGYGNAKELLFGQSSGLGKLAGQQNFSLKPKLVNTVSLLNPAGAVYVNAGIATMWLDTATGGTVQHLGLKAYYDNNVLGAAVPQGFMTFYVETFLRCRHVK